MCSTSVIVGLVVFYFKRQEHNAIMAAVKKDKEGNGDGGVAASSVLAAKVTNYYPTAEEAKAVAKAKGARAYGKAKKMIPKKTPKTATEDAQTVVAETPTPAASEAPASSEADLNSV